MVLQVLLQAGLWNEAKLQRFDFCLGRAFEKKNQADTSSLNSNGSSVTPFGNLDADWTSMLYCSKVTGFIDE